MIRTIPHLSLVPTSLAEVNIILAKIGECERAIEQAIQTLDAKVATLREEANLEAAPHEEKLKQLTASLLTYATANREVLLAPGKKSVVLPGGEFGWRNTPGKVTFGRGGAEKATKTLEDLGLTKYLRTITEPDKEALLRDRPVITGIKYTKVEAFYVKPASGKEPETFPGKSSRQSKKRA